MTEEQKRFKILKKTSYEEQISTEKTKAIFNTFFMGFSAAVALVYLPFDGNLSSTAKEIYSYIVFIASIISAYNLKGLVEAISKKTLLQSKIEDINNELEMFENEERKGKTK